MKKMYLYLEIFKINSSWLYICTEYWKVPDLINFTSQNLNRFQNLFLISSWLELKRKHLIVDISNNNNKTKVMFICKLIRIENVNLEEVQEYNYLEQILELVKYHKIK